jgi:sec-independent protein translocase protein TatC
MSFGEHLEELRSRLWKALIVPLPLAIVFFFLAPEIRAILIAPLFAALRANGQTVQVQALSPAETITTDMKLALISALAVSAPWLLYQLWKFVSPGLYTHERRYVFFLTPLSSVTTACGIALFYWVLLPFVLLFLVSFGAARARTVPAPAPPAAIAPDGTARETSVQPTPQPQGFSFPVLDEDPAEPQPGQAWLSSKDQVLRIAVPLAPSVPNAVVDLANDASKLLSGETGPTAPQLSILEVPLTVLGGISQVYRLSEYISFTLLLLAGTVVAFQMPIGLVNPAFLREKRKWALFIMAIVAAVVTPPDVTSMLLLLIPLWLLYEFGILLLVFVPAQRVSQGRVFQFRRRAGEPDESDGRWGGSSR